MHVPLLDLRREYAELRDRIDSAVEQVIAETKFINGPQVTELEEAIAQLCKTRYAIAVASGTDALLLSLRAVGVGPGTEVITSALSFFASAGTIANLGATPVFVDVEPETFNIDAARIAEKITPRTRAIMPVHLFGHSADLEPILELARQHNIAVVEDAAQSLSARYKNRMSGSFGDLGCFSFYPTKNLGCAGDGGMIVTSSEELNDKLRALKAHGARVKYYHDFVGYNSRLDTLQAAILLAKLPHLDQWSKARRKNAEYYNRRFAGHRVEVPVERAYAYHIYNQYTIQVDDRDGLKEYLTQRQIGWEIYYPRPLHLQECFRHLGYREGDLPVAERCAGRVISLPIYPMLTEAEREYVADAVIEFVS